MKIRHRFYGWFDDRRGMFRLSLEPPDAPVRPSIAFACRATAENYVARKRGAVMWLPPLTRIQEHYINPIALG